MKGRCQRNYQREAAIAQMRRDGLTFAQIAAKLGVSRQAIHRVFHRSQRVDSPRPQS